MGVTGRTHPQNFTRWLEAAPPNHCELQRVPSTAASQEEVDWPTQEDGKNFWVPAGYMLSKIPWLLQYNPSGRVDMYLGDTKE